MRLTNILFWEILNWGNAKVPLNTKILTYFQLVYILQMVILKLAIYCINTMSKK